MSQRRTLWTDYPLEPKGDKESLSIPVEFISYDGDKYATVRLKDGRLQLVKCGHLFRAPSMDESTRLTIEEAEDLNQPDDLAEMMRPTRLRNGVLSLVKVVPAGQLAYNDGAFFLLEEVVVGDLFWPLPVSGDESKTIEKHHGLVSAVVKTKAVDTISAWRGGTCRVYKRPVARKDGTLVTKVPVRVPVSALSYPERDDVDLVIGSVEELSSLIFSVKSLPIEERHLLVREQGDPVWSW